MRKIKEKNPVNKTGKRVQEQGSEKLRRKSVSREQRLWRPGGDCQQYEITKEMKQMKKVHWRNMPSGTVSGLTCPWIHSNPYGMLELVSHLGFQSSLLLIPSPGGSKQWLTRMSLCSSCWRLGWGFSLLAPISLSPGWADRMSDKTDRINLFFLSPFKIFI